LAGQIVTLAILLFILGLILIGLEIFVLPGSAILGISGVVLVILSLALATLEKKPETTQEWISFGTKLGGIGVSLAGAILLVSVVAWYLPSIPWASRLILKPPTEGEVAVDELGEAPAAGAQADLSALLGAIGVAATTLRPAGLAQFGAEYVGVITLVCVFIALPLLGGLVFHYWPKTRVGRQFFLNGPDEDATIASMPVNTELESLRGRFGRAISALRPAGVVEFDGKRIDTIT